MRRTLIVLSLLGALGVAPSQAQMLRGSAASLDRQNTQAAAHDFSYLRRPADVDRFVRLGLLVRLQGNANYSLHDVSYPYVRPEVKTFVERLSSQYRTACGEQMVVTSATRPLSHQASLANGSNRSVHPTGMAVDLRRPANSRCRVWLENVLADLTRSGVIEAIEERRPPHYHIAVFPEPYERYVMRIDAPRDSPTNTESLAQAESLAHHVLPGDTLWDLARRHGTTVERIQRENDLRTARIVPGQVLRIPSTD